MNLSSQRKDSLEKRAINDKQNQEQAKAKEISRREKERSADRSSLVKRLSKEETDPDRNTDERRKVVNVGRPDTAKGPMDPRSKIAKQAEIQRKIIENQEKSMSLQKYHNLPEDLVAAVRSVLEGKNPFAKKDEDDKKKPSKNDDDADDKDAKAKKDDSDDEDDADKPIGKDGKKTKVDIAPNMKTANEEVELEEASAFHVRSVGQFGDDEKMHGTHKNLKSALAAANKIKGGHVAVTHGPGNAKNGYEKLRHWVTPDGHKVKPDVGDEIHPKHGIAPGGNFDEETANEELKGGQKKLDKNHNGKLDEQDFKMKKANSTTKTVYRVHARSIRNRVRNEPSRWQRTFKKLKDAQEFHKSLKLMGPGSYIEKIRKEEVENIAKTNASMKEDVAEIDEGIVKNIKRSLQVKTSDDDFLKDMSKRDVAPHSPGGLQKAAATRELKRRQKNTNEEIALSDEETARILAKLNEADDEDEKHDGPEHIVMQLRKAKSLGANNRPIHFHDGSKVKVDAGHVQKALDMHGSFKKAPEKDEFTQKLQASHASFKSAIGAK
jgi:hypothetical protein